MIYSLEGRVKVTMEHSKGAITSVVKATDFYLTISKNLDQGKYLDKNGLPTAAGSHSLTVAFVMGLIGNIHMAHKKGYRNDAEHLRYIIAQLERGFVELAEPEEGIYPEGGMHPDIQVSEFRPVTATEPEIGLEVIGYAESWIHPDFNPDGKRICFRSDDGDWHTAGWCDSQDYYASYHTADGNEPEPNVIYENENTPPTHYFIVPQTPAEL